ncbi:hypothetical protein B0H11DRAFT_1742871 [Mycena galericulata]|nr:hypothetical protein B0H11DRAFT_1742871 [Mycena galericulata]
MDKQAALTSTRNRLYTVQKRVARAQISIEDLRKLYRALRTWEPTRNGLYTAEARKLARDLTFAGCAAGKIAFAIRCCAETFGIRILGPFMSRRTVGRALDEGGTYGQLQIAREIQNAAGFIEGSDGTTHRGITVESRHITLAVPSYAPGVDDSDTSTWTHRTRFLEVAPAIDHTAQRQFVGTLEAANRITDIYNRSPLAAQEKRLMDKNEYWRKKLGENKDHAADGKKGFRLSAEKKKNVAIQDLGRAAMEDDDVQTSEILETMLSITEDDLEAVGNISTEELASASERTQLTEQALERKLGEVRFDALTPTEQENSCTHLFGGCCSHKDLNVVEYGYKAVQRVYSTYNLPPPILLANKANSATIGLGSADDAAVQKAMESSTAGAIKLLQLIGALLRHKDGERGYQDRCTLFMREMKLELYNLDEPNKFPDVSNNRYGAYTYAAAEVVCFHGIIQSLITDTIDAKTKSGQANHVEYNILKGLNCAVTMTELVALALYGISVSWPYMAQVRGTKEKLINLIDLTDLHRKLPEFCAHIASNPHIILDPTTPQHQLTIDGKPFLNEFLLDAIAELRCELPNLFLVISTMFSGCETGWVQFTPEFHVGGTFSRLTPEQRAILFIPSTNDANEGMLGSFRVHMRYHPNSTAVSFTNQTRVERNNTEAFIKKCCDAAVQKFVMREVRTVGASGARAKFRRALAVHQQSKSEKGRMQREKAAMKKKTKAARLAATALEFDINKIEDMSSVRLKDQLAVYRDILKDEILSKMLWKNMTTVAVRRNLVLEARTRELARRHFIYFFSGAF